MTRWACFLLAVCATTGLCSQALASPTTADFRDCNERAAAILLDCLNEYPPANRDACWTQARSANDFCYRTVLDQHRPDSRRIEAERKAEAERR